MRATLALSSGATLGVVACSGRIADLEQPPSSSSDGGAFADPDDAWGAPADAAGMVDAGEVDADGADVVTACNGLLPPQPCMYGGPPSPPFDLAVCGLVPDGDDAGDADGGLVTASQFCLDQNPMHRALSYYTRAMQVPDAGGEYVCVCGNGFPGGRAPEGLNLAPRSVRGLGDFFAASAEAEAASIDGFEILAAELAAHDSPRRLVRACRRAAADERRHASVMESIAARFGSRPRPTPVVRGPVRSLEAVALENAVVGCVVETFAALVAQWQAAHATEPAIAAAMRSVARDEARHAALSWRVHEWLGARLGSAARGRVGAALTAALGSLADGVLPNAFEDRTMAGLPSAREGRALAYALAATLGPAAG